MQNLSRKGKLERFSLSRQLTIPHMTKGMKIAKIVFIVYSICERISIVYGKLILAFIDYIQKAKKVQL